MFATSKYKTGHNIRGSAARENDRILATLAGLRELGIGLAVDAFGTGYSASSYLRRFPVTMFEIDRSFSSGIERAPNDAGRRVYWKAYSRVGKRRSRTSLT